jgi:hypothetical protein
VHNIKKRLFNIWIGINKNGGKIGRTGMKQEISST